MTLGLYTFTESNDKEFDLHLRSIDYPDNLTYRSKTSGPYSGLSDTALFKSPLQSGVKVRVQGSVGTKTLGDE